MKAIKTIDLRPVSCPRYISFCTIVSTHSYIYKKNSVYSRWSLIAQQFLQAACATIPQGKIESLN